MAVNQSNYDLLIEKLDRFIRKFYKNQLIKGGIYSLGLLVVFYTGVAVLEYIGNFGVAIRTILFYSFLAGSGLILVKLLIIPLTKLYNLGPRISHEVAARIIGRHFTEVKDKLINVLQLKDQADKNSTRIPGVETLIRAGIDQKIKALKPVPFTRAIDLKKNRKYLKFALIPISVFGLILLTSPGIIKDSTIRLVGHNTYFEVPAPFEFIVENKDLKTAAQEDFNLSVKVIGVQLPDEVNIEFDGNTYRLAKVNKTAFQYIFKNLQTSVVFRLTADGLYSGKYELTALPNPIILDFEVRLDYPKYIGKKGEVLKNTGDMIIPEGTLVNWTFNTKNTGLLTLRLISNENQNDGSAYFGYAQQPSLTAKSINSKQEPEGVFQFSSRFFKNNSYTVKPQNRFIESRDSITYWINVVKDLYPQVDVEEQKDSTAPKRLYFAGIIKDDYGFSKLTFNYKKQNPDDPPGKQTELRSDIIAINPDTRVSTQSRFFHFWDLNELDLLAGDEVEYYFEVWDNDGVNGSKSARSEKRIFKTPTLKEVEENQERNNQKIKENIEKSAMMARKLQRELKEMDKKLLDKKSLTWEEKKKIQDILETQKELQQNMQTIKKELSSNFSEQSEYKQINENIIQKQEQLEELFKKIMTDEMKELFKKMEALLEELDKSKIQEMLEKMKMDNKDIEKELDRTLEIFKQLEMEQKLQNAIDKLNALEKEQKELSEKSKEKSAESEQLLMKQEELNKDFEDVKKELEEMKKLNSELEFPNDIKDTKEEENEIDKEMQNSSEMLEKGKNSKASESQKNASGNMKKMNEKLQHMQAEMQMEGNEEDLNSLRDLLENVVKLSFDQEALMAVFNNTDTRSPQYVKHTQDQKKIKDDAKMIEDSLYALSKRIVEIESFVNREITDINQNMEKTIELMADRQTAQAVSKQQYIMTSLNNLALLLSEVVEQMQQQMANQKEGSQQCSKPGGCKKPGCKKPGHGKPSISSMKGLQQQLNKQIEGMKNGMKPGQNSGNGSMSRELAKLAAQQEAIRNELPGKTNN